MRLVGQCPKWHLSWWPDDTCANMVLSTVSFVAKTCGAWHKQPKVTRRVLPTEIFYFIFDLKRIRCPKSWRNIWSKNGCLATKHCGGSRRDWIDFQSRHCSPCSLLSPEAFEISTLWSLRWVSHGFSMLCYTISWVYQVYPHFPYENGQVGVQKTCQTSKKMWGFRCWRNPPGWRRWSSMISALIPFVQPMQLANFTRRKPCSWPKSCRIQLVDWSSSKSQPAAGPGNPCASCSKAWKRQEIWGAWGCAENSWMPKGRTRRSRVRSRASHFQCWDRSGTFHGRGPTSTMPST